MRFICKFLTNICDLYCYNLCRRRYKIKWKRYFYLFLRLKIRKVFWSGHWNLDEHSLRNILLYHHNTFFLRLLRRFWLKINIFVDQRYKNQTKHETSWNLIPGLTTAANWIYIFVKKMLNLDLELSSSLESSSFD